MIRLTRQQVQEIDRLAIEEYHIPGIVLMENAARALADAAFDMLGERRRVTIVCGGGNNGGDGFAVARHLHNGGCVVEILDARTKPSTGDAEINWRIVRAMGLPVVQGADFVNADLVIDALFGTGLARPVEGKSAEWINAMTASGKPILAVDLPSGMDCDNGEPLGVCVRASRTVTFVAEKAGFANLSARQFTGEIIVGDIGCPRELIGRVRGP